MVDKAFQEIGDRLTTALITGDFDLYQALFALPCRITPRNGTPYGLEDLTALKADFLLYHQTIESAGVTDIFRDVQEVSRDRPDRTVVRVITHILRGTIRVAEPFLTCFFLVRGPAGWLITEIESSQEHINWSLGHPSTGFGWV